MIKNLPPEALHNKGTVFDCAFRRHGIYVDHVSGDETQGISPCPFCEKENKFYYNRATGVWDCKACGEHGNFHQFLQRVRELGKEATPDTCYADLAALRAPLTAATLQHFGVVRHPFRKLYAVPVGPDLHLWQRAGEDKKRILMATPGQRMHLWNEASLHGATDGVFVGEGPWDGMALWQTYAHSHPGWGFVAVPGAHMFKEPWAQRIAGTATKIILAYDHDDAGRRGQDKAAQMLLKVNPRLHLFVVDWQRYAQGKEPGYDVRDCFAEHGAIDREKLCIPYTDFPASAPAPTVYALASLKKKKFPPLRYVVGELLPEGLALLVGEPKLGKSFLALYLGYGVATGTKVFSMATDQGEVLYYALEDSERRLRGRLDMVYPDDKIPDNFYVTHLSRSTPKLGKGLEDEIEAWMLAHPGTHLIMIDTMAKVRQPQKQGNQYIDDTLAISELQRIALEHHICIAFNHHVRKMRSLTKNYIEDVSGTYGLTGVADTVWVLRRTRFEDAVELNVTGRDIGEQQLALTLTAGVWRIEEDSLLKMRSQITQAIFSVLKDKPLLPKEVAEKTGKSRSTIRSALSRMARTGQVVCDKSGKYSLSKLTKGFK